MDSNTKYALLLKEFMALDPTDSNGMSKTFFPVCSLAELIHSQTIYPLSTNISRIDTALNLNSNEKLNDVFEYYFTGFASVIPVLYRQLIFLCGPNELKSFNWEEDSDNPRPLNRFKNQKSVIISYCNALIDREVFVTQYLEPFLNEELKLEDICGNEAYEEIKREFMQKTLDNILVDSYCSLEELLYKVVALPKILRQHKYCALVVIEGMNRLTSHRIELNYVNESKTKRKICLNFGKKRSKHMGNEIKKLKLNDFNSDINSSSSQKEMIEAIQFALNDLHGKHNINLIQMFYDQDDVFHRSNCLAYKQQKFFKQIQSHFSIPIDGYPIEFIFKMPSNLDKHKVYFLEPTSHLFNSSKSFFALLTLTDNDVYLLQLCFKERDSSEITILTSKEIKVKKEEEDLGMNSLNAG